jgi:hypothetical protein
MIRTNKHREKRKQRTTSSSRKLQRKQIPIRGKETREKLDIPHQDESFVNQAKTWSLLSVQICADVEDDLSRNLVRSRSVTNAVVRKKVLREKTTQYGRRAMKTTDFSLSLSLALSLAKLLFSFYTFISSFQSPRSRCVHVARFCGWNSLRGGKRGHSEERLLS